jgi:hypothetical protein
MAAKKKKAKRKAPAKRKAARKTKAKRSTKRAPSGDRFSQLTAAHAKAVAAGEHHFAKLIKRELTKGGRRKTRR